MYRTQQDGTSSAEQFHLSASSATSPFTHFNTPVYVIDPNLPATPHHLHPAARPNSGLSPQIRPSSLEAVAPMDPPRAGSRAGSTTPGPVADMSFRPTDRQLPSRNVNRSNFTGAFVQFILYCNPNFQLDVDTSTLISTFESPPKSDNKDFETFRLFELIKKLESKEIKTWSRLALDLGVEAPDTSKGQSVQKVQQYTVRLKRWMRAMHIDAFFEYLMGKQHVYFTEIPPPNHPYPTGGRDGVAAEEDLAIRALDPSFRPKRGRRRNSETADQDDDAEPNAKQPRLLESASAFSTAPMSAIPLSAHLDTFGDPWTIASAVTPQSFAPWSGRPASAMPSAISAAPHLRWQLGQSGTPSTPHPMSALSTSMSAHIDAAFDGEPKSAVTPSTRRRRRHGPAVSSAWPSTSAPGTKPRGRPPANRNVQDGPYNTFPADPANDKAKAFPSSLPTPLTAEERPSVEQHSPPISTPSASEGKPGRLSLQVPQHTGNPVRLATPPTLLVNGETKESETRSDSDDPTLRMISKSGTELVQPQVRSMATGKSMPEFTFETLKKVVASDLLRADMIGRRRRLSGDEAKRLADAVLDRLAVPRSESGDLKDHLARLTAASWLGVGHHVNVPLGPSAGHGKRIQVTRFRTSDDGYEEITFAEDLDDVREIFDIFWHVSQGGCVGNFEMKGVSLAGPQAAQGPESTHDLVVRKTFEASRNLEKDGWLQQSMQEVATSYANTSQPANDGIDWRSRCMALEFAAKVAKGQVERDRQRVLDQILDALM